MRGQGVYLISPLGGPERKITDLAFVPSQGQPILQSRSISWSPDSKSLAFVDRATAADPFKIFLVALDTGENRPLTGPPQQDYGDFYPAFSPDGRTLAFVRYTVSGAGDVFLEPPGGGNPTRVTSDKRSVYGLAWTPDGNDLVFSSNRSGASSLWRMAVNGPQGKEPKPVPEPAELALARAGSEGLFRLAYASFITDSDVWRYELPHTDHPTRLIASTRYDHSAKYSPDGKRIVFVSDRSGYSEIWVCDADGANSVQLTSLNSFAGSPRWSLDASLSPSMASFPATAIFT